MKDQALKLFLENLAGANNTCCLFNTQKRRRLLLNGRITLADTTDRYAVSLWGANLTDEEYDVYGINLQSGFGFNYFMEGAPRTWGVELTYRF